jgi:short-subunit dehydrogenase
MKTKDLQGQRAVITGASSGLGEEYARQLASRGADLVLAARREDRMKALAQSLEKEHGIRVQVIKSDLSRPGAARELFDAVAADGAAVTMLVNNAGIGPYARFLDEAHSRHVETIQLNVVALTELSHLFAERMIAHGKRSYITNVGSIASFQGAPNFAVYASTKSYVKVFSEILAHELRGTNVTVTCLCPGGTHTEFSASNHQELRKGADSLMMTAEAVVRIGIEAMLAGQTVVIPGFINKLACLAPRLLPSGLGISIAGRTMERNVVSTKKRG